MQFTRAGITGTPHYIRAWTPDRFHPFDDTL